MSSSDLPLLSRWSWTLDVEMFLRTRISWPSSWGTLTPHSLLGPGPPPVFEGPWGFFVFVTLNIFYVEYMSLSLTLGCWKQTSFWPAVISGPHRDTDQRHLQEILQTCANVFCLVSSALGVFLWFFLPKDHVNVREVKVQQYLSCFRLLYVTSSLWVPGANTSYTSCLSIPTDPFQGHSQGL